MTIGSRLMTAGKRVSAEYTGGAYDLSSASSYTFSGLPLGVKLNNRLIVVSLMLDASGSSSLSTSSVSVGGVALTVLNSKVSGDTNKTVHSIAYGVVPSGTSGAVVVTTSRTCRRAYVDVFALYNTELTPTTYTAVDGADSLSKTLTLSSAVAGSVVVSGLGSTSSGMAVTWTGAERVSLQAGGQGLLSSALLVGSTAAPSVICTMGNSAGRNALTAVAFAPK